MPTVFEAIAEPNRRRILDLLRNGEQPAGALVAACDLTQPAVSKHLRALREAGLVTVRPDGQRRWYGLRADGLRELEEWLTPYRRLWADRLDDLERHLDDMGRT